MPTKGYVRKNIDAVRRDTAQHFATYMAANPYYFQGVFGYPATVDNIYRAAVIICREGM
jgi:hypothetical protein